MDKSKRLRLKSKGLRLKSKRSSRRRLPPIQSGDQIDYRNMSLISRFISDQGKILSRRVTRLTLKQQRFITLAIKQARILSFLPFVNNDLYNKTKTTTKNKNKNKKQFQRRESTARTRGLEPKRKKNKPYFRTH